MIKKIPLASLYPNEKFLLSRAVSCIHDNSDFSKLPTADFADMLFVLPTREAGRLLRERAAMKFKIYGGVTSLNILLPEQLVADPANIRVPQTKILETWLEVLKEANANHSANSILPEAEYNDNTLLSYAEYLSKVRENIILESGKDTQNFTETLEKNSTLRLKLEEYITLEKEFYKRIGLQTDKAQAVLDSLNDPFANFRDVKKIILIECTEIRTAVAMLLEKLSQDITIEHYLNITEEQLENFDACGRPLTEKMLNSYYDWDIEKTVRTYSNPIMEAMKIASFIEPEKLPDCIGVLNNGLGSALTHILEEKNIAVSNPAPKPLNSFYWSKLFLHLADLRNQNIAFEDIYFFASDESVMNSFGLSSCALQIQKEIEKIQREHLISDLKTLKLFISRYPEKYESSRMFCDKLDSLQKDVRQLDINEMPEGLYNIFRNIAAANSLENMDFAAAEAALEGLKNAVIAVRNIEKPENRMLIFRHLCNSTELAGTEQFKDNAVTLSGFLDLIWYENPTLIIGGITEESFASASQEDMFFPENTRCDLNWSSAKSHFGADIHRFAQILAQYEENELFITFSAADTDGTLNTLPRLFFNVDNDKLLKHCKLLFNGELSEKIAPPAESQPTKLLYRPVRFDNMPEKISVTGLKTYIQCPYTFYLNNICNYEDLKSEAVELNPSQIGTLLHTAFEKYGIQYSDSPPELGELHDFLLNELQKAFYAQTVSAFNNITAMQHEDMKKSAAAFAEAEYKYRTSYAEHKIHTVEHKIDIDYGTLYGYMQKEWNELPEIEEELRNIRIAGKIDRIDILKDHDGKTFCHILDYKSSAKDKTPAKVHFASKTSEHLQADQMTASISATGQKKYFADMQLIIYALLAEFLRKDMNIPENAKIMCGYFNIPSDVMQTQIMFFREADYNVLRNGAKTLHHLMRRIFFEKLFWPPSFTEQYGVVNNYFPDITVEDLTMPEENNE